MLRLIGSVLILLLLAGPAPANSNANQMEAKMSLDKAFLEAVTGGDVAKVKDLLIRNSQLAHARDEKGVSAILLAVYYRKSEIVKALLDANPVLDLFEAAATGQTERVKELVSKDSNLAGAYSIDGFPVLGLATFFGHRETAVLLISAGADVNAAAKNDMRVTALHAAAASRQLEIARLLIERGADVNARQQAEFTPLHEAAASGQLEFAELLLTHGADVKAKSDAGKTPLALALDAGRTEMATLLRKHGAME